MLPNPAQYRHIIYYSSLDFILMIMSRINFY
jgi:hypothetical protein